MNSPSLPKSNAHRLPIQNHIQCAEYHYHMSVCFMLFTHSGKHSFQVTMNRYDSRLTLSTVEWMNISNHDRKEEKRRNGYKKTTVHFLWGMNIKLHAWWEGLCKSFPIIESKASSSIVTEVNVLEIHWRITCSTLPIYNISKIKTSFSSQPIICSLYENKHIAPCIRLWIE